MWCLVVYLEQRGHGQQYAGGQLDLVLQVELGRRGLDHPQRQLQRLAVGMSHGHREVGLPRPTNDLDRPVMQRVKRVVHRRSRRQRLFAASGTLVVVAFCLIAQMVGAGQLIKLLFGLEYWIAVVIIVGGLMMVYVLFGGMTATTWVQIIKACLLLGGATFMALSVLWHFGFSPEAMFAGAVKIKTDLALKDGKVAEAAATIGASIMGPGNFVKETISAISFGMALMFGTAGLPHILMRFFTVPSAVKDIWLYPLRRDFATILCR